MVSTRVGRLYSLDLISHLSTEIWAKIRFQRGSPEGQLPTFPYGSMSFGSEGRADTACADTRIRVTHPPCVATTGAPTERLKSVVVGHRRSAASAIGAFVRKLSRPLPCNMLRRPQPRDHRLRQTADVPRQWSALRAAGRRAHGVEAGDRPTGFVEYAGVGVDGNAAHGAGDAGAGLDGTAMPISS